MRAETGHQVDHDADAADTVNAAAPGEVQAERYQATRSVIAPFGVARGIGLVQVFQHARRKAMNRQFAEGGQLFVAYRQHGGHPLVKPKAGSPSKCGVFKRARQDRPILVSMGCAGIYLPSVLTWPAYRSAAVHLAVTARPRCSHIILDLSPAILT